MSGMTCTCTPRYLVVYRESERLLASAFGEDKVRVEGSSGPIHDPTCPEGWQEADTPHGHVG